ncbi:MAG: hypothetical protein ABI333_16175 [bacterium]
MHWKFELGSHAVSWVAWVTLVLAALCAGSCGWKAVAPRTVGPKQGKLRVLIATRRTEFKSRVVSRISEAVGRQNVTVDIIDTRDLGKVSKERYQVMVVVDEYRYWSLSGAVKRFVRDLGDADKKKLILLSTAGSPKKMGTMPGVDAITCASTRKDVPAISDRVLAKITKRLAPR